jgi:predicted kinase
LNRSVTRPLLVLVTGPPGAGKTTVAEALRDRVGLPLLAKDAFKETLAGPLGIEGREASRRLGGAVFELQAHLAHELAAAGVPAIVEGNFRPEWSLLGRLPPARLVQVHVRAEPEVLYRRYLARSGRHAVHYDAEAAVEMRDASARGDWAPLPLDAPLLQLDTTDDPPLEPFLVEVEAALRGLTPL